MPGADQSPIGSNVISTPTGGGAISGLGETFSPDLFSGTGNFSVPIAVPAGRNGLQPSLTIGYSTGNPNTEFGQGWVLSLPGVMRQTRKGVPVYDDRADVFILSGAEDLIPVPGGPEGAQRYQPRTEGLFARIDHYKDLTNDYWKVTSKDGMTSWYGTPAMRGTDPAVCADPDNLLQIYEWKITKTQDLFGNSIEYSYLQDTVQEDDFHKWNKLYISEIRYIDYEDSGTQFLASVKFSYEERPDPFSSYRAGFEMRTVQRCTKIETYTHDTPDTLVKSYEMEYIDERVASSELDASYLPRNGSSQLSRVHVKGHDGESEEALPPLDFTYSRFYPENNRDFVPVKGQLPSFAVGKNNTEFADIFGNGLPDIVQFDGIPRYWRNKGNGEFDLPRFMENAPSGFTLADPDVQLADANGDGRIDLIINKPNLKGYFPMTFEGLFDKASFQAIEEGPSFNLADPEVRMMDLDGNGVTDVVRNGNRLECYFRDEEDGYSKVRFVDKAQLEQFPNVSFADSRIKLADMTGDGLTDIVYVASGNIHYWPNMGHGNFGKRVQMKNAPRFPYQYNPAYVLLGDLDGDGQTDVAFIEDNQVSLWINQSGNAWGEKLVIDGTPSVSDLDSVRMVDLNGEGTAGIIWSYDANVVRADQMYYLNINGGVKPYLLHEMNNNMGAITKVEYTSSIKYYVADEMCPETRWKTPLPFPVLVVSKTEAIDEISKGKLVTTYKYRHGYWDGTEREFRGFGRVDQLDTETFDQYNENGLFQPTGKPGEEPLFYTVSKVQFTQPIETRNWFHLGPIESVSDLGRDWKELDLSHEYWQGDVPATGVGPVTLSRTAEVANLLKTLPRRARRDAIRTMRGSSLRSEVYARDNSGRQHKPYTVSESVPSVRVEKTYDETDLPAMAEELLRYNRNTSIVQQYFGSGYIFFAFSNMSRTTQWERGSEPMTSFSFSEEFDAYGIPLKSFSVAIPRGRDYTQTGVDVEPYLITLSESEVAHKATSTHYLIGRGVSGRGYEVVNDGTAVLWDMVKELRNIDLYDVPNHTPVTFDSFNLLSHSITYYDGDAYTGLGYGVLGDYGVPTRSEALIMFRDEVEAGYQSGDTPTSPAEFPAYLETGTVTWPSEYPATFQSELPTLAGYLYKDSMTDSNYETGYYGITSQVQYDWQEAMPPSTLGLVTAMKDPLGNEATVSFDTYNLLPESATDPLGNTVAAEYDYRLLAAQKVTDANDNITQVAFSPLGFVIKTSVEGKSGDDEGDTLTDPGSLFEYDLFAWMNDGQPVYAKNTVREEHINTAGAGNDTIVSIAFSDGFGRVIQSRAQAEDIIFGDTETSVLGDSGLPESQAATNQDAVGIERDAMDPLNVRVTGWTVYNNKGQVVEQYEPFYDTGFDYAEPTTAQKKQKAQSYYDPRGTVIRAVAPNGTESRVVLGIPKGLSTPDNFTPTPWESYSYDANDLAPITHPSDTTVDEDHHYTPSSSEIDALGRTVKTVDRLGLLEADEVVMQYEYDIRGNLLKTTDPLGRTAFEYTYDLANRPWRTKHIDGGVKRVVYNVLSQPIETRDDKGALTLHTFDNGNRPLKAFCRDNSSESVTLRSETVYGEGETTPKVNNLRGRVYRVFDEAGRTTINSYDFKGNPLEKTLKVIADSELLDVFPSSAPWTVTPYRTDWEGSPVLDSADYTTTMEYDALNRVTRTQLPLDVEGERKELVPTYNRAGAMQSVKLLDNILGGPDEHPYIEYIAYNARGQQILMACNNGTMTRYVYDAQTFWLSRQKTEKYTYSEVSGTHTYAYNSGIVYDVAYTYDLQGNIVSTNEKGSGANYTPGVAGASQLQRNFNYDALYRLLQATGRERVKNVNYPWEDIWRPAESDQTDSYIRNYAYDKLGNVQTMQHVANNSANSFTRTFNYISGKNQLSTISYGPSASASFSHDAVGNIIAEGSSRHLEWTCGDKLRAFYVQASTEEFSKYAQYLYGAGGERVKKLVRKQGGGYQSTVYVDGVFEYKKEVNFGNVLPNLKLGDWTIGEGLNGTEEQNLLHIGGVVLRRLGDAMGDKQPPVKYTLSDHLGNSSTYLNETGGFESREEYYPFGETSYGSYAKKRYRYNNKEKDEESGYYNYGMRYYNPWTLRFLSVDPLAGEYPFYTPYQYAGNKPINHVDIDGMEEGNPQEGDTSGSSSGVGGGSTSDTGGTDPPAVWMDEIVIGKYDVHGAPDNPEFWKRAGSAAFKDMGIKIRKYGKNSKKWKTHPNISITENSITYSKTFIVDDIEVNFELSFNSSMTETEIMTQMYDLGYRRNAVRALQIDNWGDRAMWNTVYRWDNDDSSVERPREVPFFAEFAARAAMEIPGAIYGFATGEDWMYGTELSASDQFLNALGAGASLLRFVKFRKVPGNKALVGRGFDSFSEFKKEMGTAGKGNAWHHIVEQNPDNISSFGAHKIHNTDNLIVLPHGRGSIHAKISGYYSSKQPFTNGMTVRKWLSSKSFDFQYKFGMKKLAEFGWNK